MVKYWQRKPEYQTMRHRITFLILSSQANNRRIQLVTNMRKKGPDINIIKTDKVLLFHRIHHQRSKCNELGPLESLKFIVTLKAPVK